MRKDEKDRFGDKLRDAERASEEQYFARRERELLAKLRSGKEPEAATPQQAALMRCPKCGACLKIRSLYDVQVHECPDCRGMWLNQGELEKIAKREANGWIARWLRTEFPNET